VDGQGDLFAEQEAADRAARMASAPCLFDSPARGPYARAAAFEAWCAEYGNWGSIDRSHAWRPIDWRLGREYLAPPGRCQPAVLRASTSRSAASERCGHGGGGSLHRGCCLACDWEGPPREQENPAAEDACDHAWPGWRELPLLPHKPHDGKQLRRWLDRAKALYPPGWIEAGGPVRTERESEIVTRHHFAAEWGGYDMGVYCPQP